jgi:hypothetical protein
MLSGRGSGQSDRARGEEKVENAARARVLVVSFRPRSTTALDPIRRF